MRKSLLAIPFLAAVMVAPVTASAGETRIYTGHLDHVFKESRFAGDRGYSGHHGYKQGNVKIRKRLKRQKARISKGVESGQLTRKEAKKLYRQNRHIAGLYRDYRRDGHLARAERRDLVSRLDRASNRIHRLKHNDRQRGDRFSYRYRH